jgi:hypothetical protein
MALTLDSTVGGASSNSYISRADADTFFESRYSDGGWSALSNANKDRALVAATRMIDRYEFLGCPVNSTQRLKWPRLEVRKEDGNYSSGGGTAYYLSTELPQQLKDAVCELAVALAAGTQGEAATRRVKSWSSDDQAFTYEADGRATNALPDAVMQLLAPFLRGARLVRA